MRRLLTLVSALLLACLVAAPTPASATVDAGHTALVLGFLGDPPRYAVLGQRDVGAAEWLDALFLLDLASEDPRPLALSASRGQGWPFPPPDAKTDDEDLATYEDRLVRAYVASLPEPFRRAAAARFQRVDDAHRAAADPEPRLDVKLDVTPTPSMAAVERLTRQRCEVWQDGQARARCPGCRLEDVGREREAWICPPGVAWAMCDCRDTGAWVRIVVTDADSGREVFGNRFLVAPYELLQAAVGEEHGSSGPPGLAHVGVSIHASPRAFVVAGAAAHAPSANGTWFPVWAVVPRAAGSRDAP